MDEESDVAPEAVEELTSQSGDQTTSPAEVNSVRAEVDAMKADDKVVNKDYVEETFWRHRSTTGRPGPSEDLLDF